MKRRSLSPGALTAPLPPVLVTVGDEENKNILTIAWTGILSTIPPKTYVSVRPRRHSYGILKEKGEFVINLPTAEMARKVDYCGIYTGAKVDKFKECGFTAVKSEKVNAPTIEECPLALECKVTDVLPMGTHDVFIADIVSVSSKEEIIDEKGKIRLDLANLLAYAHGEYYSLGEKLGAFGFSTDKSGGKLKKSKASIPHNTANKVTPANTVPHKLSKKHFKSKDFSPTSSNSRKSEEKSKRAGKPQRFSTFTEQRERRGKGEKNK